MKALLLISIAILLTGCASGSAVVVGQSRPAIEDWNTVAIAMEMPEGAEQIALVQASSEAGWTKQQSVDYAIEKLKKQAILAVYP